TDPTRWRLTPDGLTVFFQEYELAGYAFGQPEVTVPWTVIRDLLQPRLGPSSPTTHSPPSAILWPSSRIAPIRAAATSVNPCTGARGATSHGTSVAADLPGCRAASGAQNTGFAGYSR